MMQKLVLSFLTDARIKIRMYVSMYLDIVPNANILVRIQ